MIECFTPKRVQGKTQELIDQAIAIVDDYMGQGLCLTLRQLYYRLVAAALIANTAKSYKRVGNVVNDARLKSPSPRSLVTRKKRRPPSAP